MNALIFDTETTGLPKNQNLKFTPGNIDNWPRVIQLAWELVYTDSGEVIRSRSHLIKPDGWEVPKEKFWIENNHSTERCEQFGISIIDALDEFIEDHSKAAVMVAHNIAFDYPTLGSEMLRYGKKCFHKIPKHCTKLDATGVLKIPGKNGLGFKSPKLVELYRYLFNQDFDGAHDALADVKACRLSYIELLKRGVRFTNV